MLTQPTSVPSGPLSIKIAGPNPLREGQRVTFKLSAGATGARGGHVRVLDAQGRIVRRLWSGDLGVAPAPTPSWDGRDDGGLTVPPGLYLATLCAGQRTSAARVVFLR